MHPHMPSRRLPVPPLRSTLLDFLHFARRMPLVTVERRMRLAPLVAARAACPARPSWSALFIKAFALVAARHGELRRSYCSFPWPHFYEHEESVCFFSVERMVEGAPVVLFGNQRRPDQTGLLELNGYIRDCQTGPVECIKMYRRMRRTERAPVFLRRMVWGWIRAVGGAMAVEKFGTFGLSSVGSDGAGLVTVLSVSTSTLHSGVLEADGSLDFRLTFDHRVYDGAFAARVLAEVERALLGEILAEVAATGSKPPEVPAGQA